MVSLVIGVVLLAASVFLFRMAMPKDGEPTRIPDKWGLPTMTAVAILCLGVTAIVLIAKGMMPA